MPNWADTHIVYYGDRSRLERLYDAYNKATYGRGEVWVDEIFHAAGFPVPDAIADMRSVPYDCYLSGDVLYACHNDAYEPDIEGYAALASAFGVDFDLFSTEPGCLVAVTTDVEGEFFPDRIVVFSSLDGSTADHPLFALFDKSETYFTSFEDLINAVRSFWPGFTVKDVEDAQFQLNAILKLCVAKPDPITICRVEVVEKSRWFRNIGMRFVGV